MKYLLCVLLICVLAGNANTGDGQHTPRIITAPQDQNVVTGRVASFVCRANGNPKPQIEWRKNGKRMVTQRYTVIDIPNGSVLQIEPVRPNRDNATYECIAENGVGEPVRALAVLNVLSEEDIPKGFPWFSLQPHMQGVERGKNALIPCKAEGDPEPHVLWLKDMVPIDMSNTRYSFYQSTSLQITDAEEQDSGQYECVAENKLGSAYSDLATLYVSTRVVPPYFSIPPEPMYEVMPGSNLNLTCVAVGSPLPFVSWKMAQNELSPENSMPISKNVLKLEDIRESKNYTCVAHSKLGNIESFTQVIVQSLPRAPTNVRISDVTTNSVRLSWSYDIGAENIVYFVIQYKPKISNQELSEISGITTFFYMIGSLTPYTEYVFYVLAVNAIGRGTHSTPVYATTGEQTTHNNGYFRKLGSARRNVQARPLSSSTIVVQWDQPEEPNGRVNDYKVYYTAQPSVPTSAWNTQTVDSNPLTTISDLQPHMIYTIRVQAFTSRGSGPISAPVKVKTQQGVPSQPSNLRAVATSTTTVQLNWQKPSHAGEAIIGYEVYWNDTFTNQEAHRSIPDVGSFTLGDLYPDTLYYVWISAKSRRGEGAATPPFPVKTEKYVPGEPRDVKATAINSTTVFVEWNAPINKEKNWLIRGFQIHVQEVNSNGEFINKSLRYDMTDGLAEEYNITGLQPDTEYSIQVAAVTRKGDGTRSQSKTVRTLGGVPTKPHILIRILHDEPQMSVEVRWSRPNHTYGQLLNYKLIYGRIDSTFRAELEILPSEHQKTIGNLDRGARYEFRMAGRNSIGWGKESVTYVQTPEGIPTAPPQNLTYRLQSPTTVVVNWDPPLSKYRNGKIFGYGVNFHKVSDSSPLEYNTSQTRVVFSSLDENTEYSLRVRAYTSQGAGPYSSRIQVHTPGDVTPAPTNVLAFSTSETSVEVWWDVRPFFNNTILGYQVFYTQTAFEDLDRWHKKEVPLTCSAALTGLEANTMYAIRVAALTNQGLGRLSELITVRTEPTDVPLNLQTIEVTTHKMTLAWKPPKKLKPIRYKITYGAHKEFYDSQGFSQEISVNAAPELVESETTECKIDKLMPFTTYEVNVTAIPWDESYRPPARITVTTDMSAPKPMVKTDSIESQNEQQITVILPHASEEYGPISHYFLVVVPKNFVDKDPDKYTIEELCSTPIDRIGPYIAAKWLRGTIPHTFSLGDGQRYNGFLNRILIKGVLYQIFVRAVVDAPQQNLFTSSSFSDILSLESITTSEFNEGKDDSHVEGSVPKSGADHKSADQTTDIGVCHTYKDGKCFKLFDNNLLKYSDAKNLCFNNDESSLVSVRSADEQHFLFNILDAFTITHDVWIGAQFVDNRLKWTDNTTVVYTNWANIRPLNASVYECVRMSMVEPYSGKWFNEPCDQRNAVVCEKVDKHLSKSMESEERFKKSLNEIEFENITKYLVSELEKTNIELNKTKSELFATKQKQEYSKTDLSQQLDYTRKELEITKDVHNNDLINVTQDLVYTKQILSNTNKELNTTKYELKTTQKELVKTVEALSSDIIATNKLMIKINKELNDTKINFINTYHRMNSTIKELSDKINNISICKEWSDCLLFRDHHKNISQVIAIPIHKNEKRGTYDSAVNICKKYNSTLLSIESREKQKFMEFYLKSISGEFWLSGHKNLLGKWEWSNGKEFSYTNWATVRPESYFWDSKCLYINANNGLGRWHHYNCGYNFGIICEFELAL